MDTDFQVVAIFHIFPQKPCVFIEFPLTKPAITSAKDLTKPAITSAKDLTKPAITLTTNKNK